MHTTTNDGISLPKPQSELNIGNGALVIVSQAKMPNAFHRLMQRLLLGFKWKKP